MSEVQNISMEMEKELNKLSCPFTWDIEGVAKIFMKYDEKYNDNLVSCEVDEDAMDFYSQYVSYAYPIEIFMNKLHSCYKKVLYHQDVVKAKEMLEENKELLEVIQRRDPKLIRSIQHIYDAMNCHLLYKMGKIEEVQIILENIIPISDMNTLELGALDGCQCLIWTIYVEHEANKAIDFASRATKNDPEYALWHILLAANIRCQRRQINYTSAPSQLEKEHFEIAYKLDKNPRFGMYVAQMYREERYGKYLSREQRKHEDEKLLILYKQIMKHSELTESILLRLALGFIRINSSDQLSLAKLCLDMIEESKPTNNGWYLHYKGLYYEKCADFKTATEYLKKAVEAGNDVAEWNYISCGWKCNLVEPLDHLKYMLEKYTDAPVVKKQRMLLCIAICYYLKNDFTKATNYFLQAIELDPAATMLKTFFTFLSFDTKSDSPYYRCIYGFLNEHFLKEVRKTEEYNQNRLIRVQCQHITLLCRTNYKRNPKTFQSTFKRLSIN